MWYLLPFIWGSSLIDSKLTTFGMSLFMLKSINKCSWILSSYQWAIPQLALPYFIVIGWKVRSWVWDPLGACISYQLKKKSSPCKQLITYHSQVSNLLTWWSKQSCSIIFPFSMSMNSVSMSFQRMCALFKLNVDAWLCIVWLKTCGL